MYYNQIIRCCMVDTIVGIYRLACFLVCIVSFGGELCVVFYSVAALLIGHVSFIFLRKLIYHLV